MRIIPKNTVSNYIYKIRGYGNHVALESSNWTDDNRGMFLCSTSFILDSSEKRGVTKHCKNMDVDSINWETLSIINPDEYVNSPNFDIVAYKKYNGQHAAICGLFSGEPDWDWVRDDYISTQNEFVKNRKEYIDGIFKTVIKEV